MNQAEFGTALRSAIRARGLTLQSVRTRLAQHGIVIGLATLSSWQSGQNRPERAESLRAVAAIEQLLALPAGSLMRLLGPRRPRGRTTPSGWSGITRMISHLGSNAPVRVLLTEDQVHVSENRLLRTVRTKIMGTVTGSHAVDRWCVGCTAEPKRDLNDIRVVPVRRCRTGTTVRDDSAHLLGTELLLDRVYRRDETFVIEYDCVFDRPLAEDEYFRVITQPTDLYVLQVSFRRTPSPARCVRFLGRPRGTDQGDATLISRGTAMIAEPDAAPGVHGMRWEWDPPWN